MERRKFIKTGCRACLLAGAGYLFADLLACTPALKIVKTDIVDNQILLPAASFSQAGFQIIRPKGWFYDIAVQKKADNTFQALLLQCTHQDNQLMPAANGYSCSLHGSQFNKDGIATKGPAERNLKQYATSVNNDKLIIHLKQGA